jgi:hypothetical protein
VIERLVVFGGTGDLMGRYLLPGLAALQAERGRRTGWNAGPPGSRPTRGRRW